MVEDIDLSHLDSTWLDHIQSAAVTTLEKINDEATRKKISKEQAALATMAGGFLYLYHLAQVNELIDSNNTPKTMH
tara:strand:+ start:200 stop:427 length:228 start_codon:yes stop_codon:yes gene_type:complete